MNALDQAAMKLIARAENVLGAGTLIFFGFMVAALLVHRNSKKNNLQRGEYFAFMAVIYLIASITQFAWLLLHQALLAGVLWALTSSVFVVIGISGFFCGEIALARSRDAYGHTRWAILAMIPIANFFLLFKPSRDANAPTFPIVSGWKGVLFGIIFLITAFVSSKWVEAKLEAMANAVIDNPTIAEQSLGLDALLISQGLEATLLQIADEAELPIIIDEMTTISRIEADGTLLRRIFVVNTDISSLPIGFGKDTIQELCQDELFGILLRGGATLEEVFVRYTDGGEIGRQAVTEQSCSF